VFITRINIVYGSSSSYFREAEELPIRKFGCDRALFIAVRISDPQQKEQM
jgi:hypothetical protein